MADRRAGRKEGGREGGKRGGKEKSWWHFYIVLFFLRVIKKAKGRSPNVGSHSLSLIKGKGRVKPMTDRRAGGREGGREGGERGGKEKNSHLPPSPPDAERGKVSNTAPVGFPFKK